MRLCFLFGLSGRADKKPELAVSNFRTFLTYTYTRSQFWHISLSDPGTIELGITTPTFLSGLQIVTVQFIWITA